MSHMNLPFKHYSLYELIFRYRDYNKVDFLIYCFDSKVKVVTPVAQKLLILY